MAFQNTTFTGVGGTTVRDLTADKGAVYILDGNSSNGRLNLGANATVQFGYNTFFSIDGNAGHSYNQGRIEADKLTYAIKSGGGRADYGHSLTTYILNDVTFLALGSGSLFHHLQSDDNVFSGFFRMIADMSSGNLYLQFGPVEIPSFVLDVQPTNGATIIFYPSRLNAGFTPFPNVTINGLSDTDTLQVYKGSAADAHGRFYDPVYSGVTNNLLNINAQGGAINRLREYFTIDVTALRNDEARIRVVDSAGLVQFDDMPLTEDNTTIYATDGTTPLAYYRDANRWVIPALARRIGGGNTTPLPRNAISYTIRQAGFEEVVVSDLVMNAPVVVPELAVDTNYDTTIDSSAITGVLVNATANTITISENRTIQEVYNYIKWWLAQAGSLAIDDFLSASGSALTFNDYTVVLNSGITISSGGNFTSWFDATGDVEVNAFVPPGYSFVTDIYTSRNSANNAVVADRISTGTTTFKYSSDRRGGIEVFYRLENEAGDVIVDAFTLPSTPGVYNENFLVTPLDVAVQTVQNTVTSNSDKIDALTSTIASLLTEAEDGTGMAFSTEALQNSPSSGGGGSTLTAQDVWEYDVSTIETAGQAGKVLSDKSEFDNSINSVTTDDAEISGG